MTKKIVVRFSVEERRERAAAKHVGAKWVNSNGVVTTIKSFFVDSLDLIERCEWVENESTPAWHTVAWHRTYRPATAAEIANPNPTTRSGEFEISRRTKTEAEEVYVEDDRDDLTRALDEQDEQIAAGFAARARRLDMHASLAKQVEVSENEVLVRRRDERAAREMLADARTPGEKREVMTFLQAEIEERVAAEENLAVHQRDLATIEARLKIIPIRKAA